MRSAQPILERFELNSPKEYHIDKIFRVSDDYLLSILSRRHYDELRKKCRGLENKGRKEVVSAFSKIYRDIIKRIYQEQYTETSLDLDKFINSGCDPDIKVIWGDCLRVMKAMKTESIELMVTSPPYYNARDYSLWDNIDDYLEEMRLVIRESYRVLDNHRAFVFNVGDITGNDNRYTKSSWGDRRIPLGAYFTRIFEEEGFTFIDDFIWDKGEVQSNRQKNGDTPHPLYQYPVNCYEHIFVFRKHRLDPIRYPCPVCGCLKVNGNAYSGVGIKSWECKNLECHERSPANRGKRFSLRSIIMDELKYNHIEADYIKQWRRDIIKLNPVIKINSKGENKLGHTAPFPPSIPEFAVKTLSGKGEKVLDPFAGSFTSAIEATKLGRVGIGIELNKGLFARSIRSNIKNHSLDRKEYLFDG